MRGSWNVSYCGTSDSCQLAVRLPCSDWLWPLLCAAPRLSPRVWIGVPTRVSNRRLVPSVGATDARNEQRFDDSDDVTKPVRLID